MEEHFVLFCFFLWIDVLALTEGIYLHTDKTCCPPPDCIYV